MKARSLSNSSVRKEKEREEGRAFFFFIQFISFSCFLFLHQRFPSSRIHFFSSFQRL